MQKLEVGQPVPVELLQFIGSDDGASLQIMRDKTMLLVISLDRPKSSEVQETRKGSLQFRLYDSGGIPFPLVGFGRAMQFELPFNPTLYTTEFISDIGNRLDILLVDRGSKALKVIRTIGLGEIFLDRLKTGWAKAILAGGDRVAVALNQMYRGSLNQNWSSSEIVDWRE